jgi:hypothetical protein
MLRADCSPFTLKPARFSIRHLPRVTSRERSQLKITVRPLLRGQLGQVLLGVSLFEASNVAATLLILRATHTM